MHCYVCYCYALQPVYISSEILMVNSGYLTLGTNYIYVSMNVWIRRYFFKPKVVRQQKCLRITDLEICSPYITI